MCLTIQQDVLNRGEFGYELVGFGEEWGSVAFGFLCIALPHAFI